MNLSSSDTLNVVYIVTKSIMFKCFSIFKIVELLYPVFAMQQFLINWLEI